MCGTRNLTNHMLIGWHDLNDTTDSNSVHYSGETYMQEHNKQGQIQNVNRPAYIEYMPYHIMYFNAEDISLSILTFSCTQQ
jgi:hypothetical protein